MVFLGGLKFHMSEVPRYNTPSYIAGTPRDTRSRSRCRVNAAHIRQPRPDYGLGLSHFPGESPYINLKLKLKFALHLGADVKRFRGGLVCEAHRLLYHSTLGLRVMKQEKKEAGPGPAGWGRASPRETAAIPAAATSPEMCNGSEAGSYLRFIDFCITQL